MEIAVGRVNVDQINVYQTTLAKTVVAGRTTVEEMAQRMEITKSGQGTPRATTEEVTGAKVHDHRST